MGAAPGRGMPAGRGAPPPGGRGAVPPGLQGPVRGMGPSASQMAPG